MAKGWGLGGEGISRLPTDRRTVPRSSRQIDPSLAFHRFLPCARGLSGWILPSFGLGPLAPRHEQREPEHLYLEVPIYSASVSGEVTRKIHKSKGRVDTNLATLLPTNDSGCVPLGKAFLMLRNLSSQFKKRPRADTGRLRFVGRSHAYNRSSWP